MSDVRLFEFDSQLPVKPSEDEDGPEVIGEFKINGQSFEVVYQEDSSIAHLIHRVNSTRDTSKIISAVFSFMERALTPESSQDFEAMVLGADGGRGLKMEHVVSIFEHVVTLVGSSDPTGSPAEPSPAPRKTGAASPARQRAAAARNR